METKQEDPQQMDDAKLEAGVEEVPAQRSLNRDLKSRHMQMIAIGNSSI